MGKKLEVIKPGIRVLGVDDGKFLPHCQGEVAVIGVVFRGGFWIDGVMSTIVSVDGFDATSKMVKMIKSSPHCNQLKAIFLGGVTFGGFNVVDIKELNEQTNIPVIAITKKKPQMTKIESALKNLSGFEKRWGSILNAGEFYPVRAKSGKQTLYIQVAGISKEMGQEVISLTSTTANIPEPLRVAHLFASGINLYTTHHSNN